MQVRLLTGRVGVGMAPQQPGDLVEVDAAEGKRLIEAGQAEPAAVKASAKRETRVG